MNTNKIKIAINGFGRVGRSFFQVAFIIISGFFVFSFVHAEESSNLALPKTPGAVSGTGTHFEITDSEYLNITLDSSEEINLKMESVPEMVIMTIEPVSSAISTQITLSGFAPLTTYYKYQDDYHNLTEFIADGNGTHSYVQDITTPHLVFIQPRKSTKFIKDDATGGDCYLIGNWNTSTKTCILTTDVYETIQIDNDNIILDGNGRVITGSGTGNGVYLSNKSGVTLKKLNIEKFTSGITLFSSSSNTVFNNVANLNRYNGINLEWSSSNTVNNNLVNSNYQGILLFYSSNNILSNNTGNFNTRAGIYLNQYSNFNTLSGNNIAHNGFVGIYLALSSNNTVVNNISNFNDSYGIYLWYLCNNNIVNNNTFADNYYGVQLYSSNNNQIYNNNFIDNQDQARVSGSGNVFNLSMPIGGNYWSNFDVPTEGCNDSNNDNICDSPYFFWGRADYFPWIKQDGWITNQPPAVSDLNQYKSDGITAISESGIITEGAVVFKAILNDSNNDQIKLQVELKEFNQSFDEQDLLESDFVSSGNEAVISRQSLVDDQYHWRARAIDNQGNGSDWQEFGIAGNVDFVVDLPLSYKAANLAKELVNRPDGYLWGGKGWDYGRSEWITSSDILASTGYEYLRGLRGKGVDCSGLITWAFNRSFDPFLSADYNFVQYVNADGLHSDPQSDFVAEIDILPGDAMFFDWGKFNPTTQRWEGLKDDYIDHTAIYVGESGGYDVVNASSRAVGIVPEIKDIYKLISGFEGFRRVHQANVETEIVAGSPVDLVVTDPDGFTITPNSVIPSDEEYIREVPGVLYYLEIEKGHDGKPIDRVYSPVLKTGDYIVKVVPAADALPTDIYDLEFRGRGQAIILADNVPISQIPSEGYGVAVGATGTISTFVSVSIDIKPGSFPNSINLGSKGTVPVAIFGTTTFDVTQINPSTVTLANASIKFKGNGQTMVSYEDVNGDSILDITAHVITEALELTETNEKAELNGFLIDGRNIKGSDFIRVVP